jgi:DNA-directed RNA polymerase subunit RPC12/RpoP
MFAVIVHCSNCGREYPPALTLVVCPDCGADVLMVGVHSPGETRTSAAIGQNNNVRRKVINLVGRDPDSGRTSPFLKHWVTAEFSGQRRQWEYVERTLSRPENLYEEVCYDPRTGEPTFRKAARRDDQSAHGRRGRQQS